MGDAPDAAVLGFVVDTAYQGTRHSAAGNFEQAESRIGEGNGLSDGAISVFAARALA